MLRASLEQASERYTSQWRKKALNKQVGENAPRGIVNAKWIFLFERSDTLSAS